MFETRKLVHPPVQVEVETFTGGVDLPQQLSVTFCRSGLVGFHNFVFYPLAVKDTDGKVSMGAELPRESLELALTRTWQAGAWMI